MKSHLPTVSVIIPVCNEERYIAQCLQSVVQQDYPPELLEILVIDGRSEDNTREIVEEFRGQDPRIQLLDNPSHIVSTAMNIGIRNTSGEVIVRVDGHCLLEPDYVRQCVRYLAQTGADNVGGLLRARGENYVGEAIAIAMSYPFGVGDSRFHYSEREQYVDTVYLGAFPRRVFDHVGLFDEELIRNQDYELNYRLRAAGGKIFLTPAIKSWYITRGSLPQLCKQYFQYGFWKVAVLRKHPRSLRFRQTVPPALVFTLLASGLLGFFSRLSAYLFLSALSTYFVSALLFSLWSARKQGWKYLPMLPCIFASLHFSWGLGFLWGLARALFQRYGPF
jgi:glycosyltransferase involved in cell wall biosynthesis